MLLAAQDLADLALGRRDPLIPPRRLLYDGPRDPQIFRANGLEFLEYYREICHLQPDEHVLDVGSGMGRKTVPLTTYLSPQGRYVGIEINRRGVKWCRSRISSRFPNFEFRHIDVHNRRYNPTGTTTDAEYSFPFADHSFDMVVLASVFTHMLPSGVSRYVSEISRVLRPGSGRCLVSFFLLNRSAEQGIRSSSSDFSFVHRWENHAVEDAAEPENAVAYNESFVRSLCEEAGLEVTSVYPGSWCGRSEHLSYQDLLLLRPAGNRLR